MKKIILILLILLSPLTIFASILKFNFDKKNKSQFFLHNCSLKDYGVEIAEGDSIFKSTKAFNTVFLNFENTLPVDSKLSRFKESVFGSYSALFYESRNFLRFRFENHFDQGMVLEFWLKPFTVDNGTVLSTEYLSSNEKRQSFQVYFKSGKLYFHFENLFMSNQAKKSLKSIILSSKKLIPLKEWHHHRLTYNPATGAISYYLDNKLITQEWGTSTGNPSSPVLYLTTPLKWDYVIGKGFRGLMDNFFLSANLKQKFNTSIFDKRQAFIHSRVIKLPSLISIYDLGILSELAKDTHVRLSYRSSNTPFSDGTPGTLLEWKDYNLTHRSLNPKIKAKYIQFRVTLYPSPNGKLSPLVKALQLKYNKIDVPTIPLGVSAFSSEGKVTLSFRENANKNIVAYKVYYGTQKNNYWGHGALQGASPVLVPVTELKSQSYNGRLYYTLKGLDLYKVYYIRVTALNDEGLESEMSDEISIRVRKLK